MKTYDRLRYLMRSPQLLWNILGRGKYDFTFDLTPIQMRNMSFRKRCNLIAAGLNLLHRRLTPYNWPIFMQAELTNYCNLKCPVCPTGSGILTRPPQAMPPELLEQLLEEVGHYLLVVLLWGWGESLLHPQLADMLRIVQRYPIATFLSTNGLPLTDERVFTALTQYPPDHLIVAIDGLTDETNTVFRKGAKLETILQGIHRLAEMKQRTGQTRPTLQMRYIVMKHNQHELPLVKAFARQHRFDLLSLRSLASIGAPENTYREFVPDAEAYRAYAYEKGKRVQRRDFLCEYAFIFPTILADGTVTTCCQDCNASSAYGLFSQTTSFQDIWFGQQAAQIRRIIKTHPESLSFCQNCPFADRPVNTCSVELFDLRRE